MIDLFHKKYAPPGSAPGELHLLPVAPETVVHCLSYDANGVLHDSAGLPDDPAALRREDAVLWLHFAGQPEVGALRRVGEALGLHPLALEDVMNHGQRPKLDDFDDHLFLELGCLTLRDERPLVDDFSLFLGEDFVVSVYYGAEDLFGGVRARLREPSGRLRRAGADRLAHALLDAVVDHAFPVLEALGERIEDLETELLDQPGPDALRDLHRLKRETLLIRRAVWPARDVLANLSRGDLPQVADRTRIYFGDVYDHAVQIIELVESYRDMLGGMLDVYLSSVSNRQNEIMKVLTVIATIFIPLTFVVGVYGMNFSVNETSPWAMPELRWDYGYPVLWAVMLGLAGAMLLYFKRRRWF
ncbi:MAG: magnesium/cobalt transporter CorA [Immundisolibacter sp.]|uniref:magnesium/cobalt transporter CorA n=1 Tax=Immundisolibacter sp. TaxID=1934948 RepID=UPI003D0D5DF3